MDSSIFIHFPPKLVVFPMVFPWFSLHLQDLLLVSHRTSTIHGPRCTESADAKLRRLEELRAALKAKRFSTDVMI